MKVILFGATGTAGDGVLRACCSAEAVECINVVARRPPRLAHEKLRLFLHQDYSDYTAVSEAFEGIDACLFCLGISVSQVSGEQEYRTITRNFAVAAARTLKTNSPDAVFHYLSGMGAGRKSRLMWARVKAETELELINSFNAVCWRPASIDGNYSDRAPWLYRTLQPVYRMLKPFRSLYIHSQDLGKAMLQATIENVRGRIIENREIRDMADRARLL